MPQAAASRTSSWLLSLPPPVGSPRAASRFPASYPRTARRQLVKACTKRFCGNIGEYTLSACADASERCMSSKVARWYGLGPGPARGLRSASGCARWVICP
jgi:hypothetical protein